MKISIIIPTYNEAQGIGKVIDQIPIKELRKRKYSVEVMIVDKESKDGTQKIAKSKGVKVVNEPRKGYGRAYKTGFAKAKGNIICTFDADCTYPVKDLPKLIDALEREKVDFITTDRFGKDETSMKFSHKLGNFVLCVAMNTLFDLNVQDSQSGMWIFKRKILPKLKLTDDGMPFSEEIKIEAFKKVKSIEVPIIYTQRVGEVKLNGMSDGLKNLMFLFKKRVSGRFLQEVDR